MSNRFIEFYQDALVLLSNKADCVTFSVTVPSLAYDILETEEEYRQFCIEENQEYSQEHRKLIIESQKEFAKYFSRYFKFVKKFKRDILFTQYTKNYGPMIYKCNRLVVGFRFSKRIFKLLNTMPSFLSWDGTILEDVMFYEKGKCILAASCGNKKLLIFDEFIYTFTNFKEYAIPLFETSVMYKYPYKLNNDNNVVLKSKRVRMKYLKEQKMHE